MGTSVMDSPRFELLENVPPTVMHTPPLASALQSFENSIFLVGLGRFPAALTACGTAVESAIRAVQGYKPSSPADGLKDTVEFALHRKPKLRLPDLRQFRSARNDFTHSGFSPKDDERAVSLLFRVGYPFFSRCVYEFHGFSIRNSVINGLWKQVEIAEKVLKEIETSSSAKPDGKMPLRVSGARALEHTVLTSLRNPLHARWTDVDVGLPDHEYAARQRVKDQLERKWSFHTYAQCPIPTCYSSECIVALSEENTSQLAPTALFCFDCGFRLGEADTILMTHLIGGELRKSQPKILQEYGVE